MSDFKKGDVVRLKSGGPDMTIKDIGKYMHSTENEAKCLWFEDNKLQSSIFSFASLEKVNK